MSGGQLRERRDAWSLDAWDPVLEWYAKAVAHMQKRPLQDPTSWNYLASIHGRAPFGQDPAFWDQCQHQTWYFLPWHRGYLAWFEQIVQGAIDELGGPSGWALPYWNYSDVANPRARVLPQAFRELQTPGGGDNPLLVERHPEVNAGNEISDEDDVSVAALDLPRFVASPGGASGGFGGPQTGFNHGGGRFGELERVPHGLVHVDIGGLMQDPDTAASDPIFWLHHANIDRLWEIWRQNPDHRDPESPTWRNLEFKLHDASKAVVTFRAADMLDTTAAPLSYRYDSLADPRGAAAPEPGLALSLNLMPAEDAVPEMVGATIAPVELGTTPATASLKVEEPTGPMALVAPGEAAVYLNVENVVGARASTNYDVYVNLPEEADPAEHADRKAGALPTFGVGRATGPDAAGGGGGLHAAFDITALVARQRDAGEWDPAALRVTFVPRRPTEDLPVVTVGRVSLYYAR